MKTIKTSITIKAKPDKIWAVLTDFERYPQWNPFIVAISGIPKADEQLAVKIQPPESGAMRFKPKIIKMEQNKELRWKGKLIIKGLFDGEHYFLLQDNCDDTTTFIHGEDFRGIMVGFFEKALDKTQKGFVLMNEAIKAECET